MVTIVDTKEKFKNFSDQYKEMERVFLIPLFNDVGYNPNETTISTLYVCDFDQEFIIPFDHSEAKNVKEENISLFDDSKPKFVIDKKRFVQYKSFENLIDIGLLYWFNTNNNYEFETVPNKFFKFQYSAGRIKSKQIPLFQICDKFTTLSKKVKSIIDENSDVLDVSPFKRYNDLVVDSFARIESNGLHINKQIFKDVFKEKIERKFSDRVYTNYNLFTSTGRPSNANDNINYAALNAKEGQKKPFVSRFGDDGMLFLFDYDAFHLRLIGRLIGYDLPPESFHSYLGKKYFDKDSISEEEYEESKKISFQLLYGQDIEEAESLEYFKKTYELKREIWKRYKMYGLIQTPIFKRQIDGKYIKNLNPGKAFSYILQRYETEFNVVVIQELLNLLKNYETELVLYTYDSMLFDYSKNDGKEVLKKIRKTMETKKMLVKGYAGKSYNNLIRVKKQ